VFDRFEAGRDVERILRKREVEQICDSERRGRVRLLVCELDDVRRPIDPDHRFRACAGQDVRSVSSPTSCIEHLLARHQRRCPPVARTMLGVDEAAGHQVWDKTFGMTARHVSDVLTVRVHPSAAVVAATRRWRTL